MESKKNKIILVSALLFLFVRNLPLCFLMPIWSHGDEIGHMDYILKISRGRIPQSADLIEPDLFLLHKVHYDSRYSSDVSVQASTHEMLGLAQYSYESHQPPLPYLVYAALKHIITFFHPSMLLQVKLLRVVSLLVVGLGIFIVYLALKKAEILSSHFYLPLLFIPLLVKDMFFSINTDTFSFLFGCMVTAGVILLFRDPLYPKYWLLLVVGTILAMWTKIPNGFLFALWPLVTVFLWAKKKDRQIIRNFLLFFLIAIILSSPWYLYNLSRYQNPFSNLSEIPFPQVPKQSLSVTGAKFFISGFLHTLIRGEFVWNGKHFGILSGSFNKIILQVIPIFIFLLGLSALFIPFKDKSNPLTRFLILAGLASLAAFCFAYFAVGGMPFYHVRYSYAALYLFMFIFAVGWKRLSPSRDLVYFAPLVGLLLYQIVYTSALLHQML